MLGEQLGDHAAAAIYRERFLLLSKQLQTWSTHAPKIRPTFEESVASGAFVALPDILRKTLPAIDAAVSAFDPTSSESALAVRDATVLSCVAGDASPTQRVGELCWVRSGSEEGGCRDPKCTRPGGSCPGSTATLRADGSVAIRIAHHKNEKKSGPRQWTIKARCARAKTRSWLWDPPSHARRQALWHRELGAALSPRRPRCLTPRRPVSSS